MLYFSFSPYNNSTPSGLTSVLNPLFAINYPTRRKIWSLYKLQEMFDGHISQIFVETADIQHDPEKLKKAKDRIDEIYGKLQAGEDFEKLARTYSDRVTSLRGGEEGWFVRKSGDENEPLLKAAWALKVGEFTKAIQGSRGWHIIMVTDREPAYLTPFGARRRPGTGPGRRR